MVLSNFVIRECEESKRFKTYSIWTWTENEAVEIIRTVCKTMMLGDMLVENSIYTISVVEDASNGWGMPIFHGWTDAKTLDELFLNEKPILTYIKNL